MTTPERDAWRFMKPQPSAKHLQMAMYAIENRPSTPPPLASECDAYWRDMFLDICGDHDIYDALRELNPDEQYWKKEEAHCLRLVNMVLDYNGLSSWRVSEAECPPVEWFRTLFSRQRQRLMEGTTISEHHE
ncbi:hypothetical protein LTR56_022518 [Elasticomyces elasticus]|nr:hypothetical protein LTR56_022518 [Elasticomyces elasticus]KAK3632028.1 hypothetical protein LTR22_020768 [Elasticomyces elasticus]KAK4910033.1 hypothetical protein LTR49_021231 [Elasticomyces elasticus]KAK5749426.1 hypothetical protein LTS12_020536 [Elasticomyces elasticus]